MGNKILRAFAILIASAAVLGGCVGRPLDSGFSEPAELMAPTVATPQLEALPPPEKPIHVGVYEFSDATGQHKPNESFAEYSRAVTQGGAQILVDVLKRAGRGKWFKVVERVNVKNLISERGIISQTRKAYQPGSRALPPMLFAGVLLEGAIVGYDTNDVTGGAGARFLGVGGNTEYRRDVVTVSLRAVSVATGEVLASVTTTKTLYSVLLRASVFRFVGVSDLLEIEAGLTRNEPGVVAVRQAMELAVYALIVEGAEAGHWRFAGGEGPRRSVLESYRVRYGPRDPAAGTAAAAM